MRPHIGFRLASPAPVADYDSLDDYVQLVHKARQAYSGLLMQDLTSCCGKKGLDAQKCSWSRTRREGAKVLLETVKRAPMAETWALCANDALVFALKSSTCAFAWKAQRFMLTELLDLLCCQLDFLLGYPDCCWGWTGPGVLRELVSTSFHAMISPPKVRFVAKTRWPLHMAALLMARHQRLGAQSGLRDMDEHILCLMLQLAVAPEHGACLSYVRSVALEQEDRRSLGL